MSKKGQAQEWYIKGPYHYATGKIIEDTRKSVVVLRTSFFSRWRSRDLICIIFPGGGLPYETDGDARRKF